MKKWVASIWDVYGLIIETPALRNVPFCNVSMLILCDLAGDLKTSQHVREAAGDGSQVEGKLDRIPQNSWERWMLSGSIRFKLFPNPSNEHGERLL